nr:zinc finger protein 729-like isoform X2 [Megalopta genalis]
MARVYVYERPVDSVYTDVSFYKKLNDHIAAGKTIKQEPCDTDDNYQDSTFSPTGTNDTKTAATVETIVPGMQSLDEVNNKENELALFKDCADTYTSNTRVINTRKRKLLTFDNLKVSEEKACVRPKSPEPIETAIECGICFLNFKSLKTLRIHTDNQTEVANLSCNKCHTICKSPHLLHDRIWMRRCKINTLRSSKVSFCCRFCKAEYTTKSNLQCHVFHNHGKLLPCSAKKSNKRSETDKLSKIKKLDKTDETSETDKFSVNYKIRETNKTRTSEIDKTSEMKENTDRHVTSPSVQQNGNDAVYSTLRKMRQTTITQFLSGYTKIGQDASPKNVDIPEETPKKAIPRQNGTLTEKIDHRVETPKRVVPSQTKTILEASEFQGKGRRKIVTRRSGATTEKVDLHLKTQEKITRQSRTVVRSLINSTNKKTSITNGSCTPDGNTAEENTPFDKRHTDSNMRKLNKNIKATIETEPNHLTLQNYNIRRMTRSSLERSTNDLNTTPVIKSPKRIRFRKRVASTPKEKLKHQSTEEKLRAKFKCKDCKLNLIRCDMFVKTETVDITQFSVEEDGDIEEMWREKTNLKSVNVSLNVSELKKVEVKKSLQNSEVPNVLRDNTKANSRMLFRCKVCKKCFSVKKNLRKHLKLRHEFFKSSICDSKYKTKVELQRHYMNKHSGFKRMQCCVCFKKFSSLAMLKQHFILHCTRVLLPKRKKRINEAVKCRMPNKKNSCKACGKRFWLETCLKEHQKLCTKMRAREKQSQNVSNAVKTLSTKRTLDNANINLDAPQPNLRSTNDHSYRAESPSMEQSEKALRSVTYANGYHIDKSCTNKVKYSCTICKKRFHMFEKLSMHVQTYSKAASFVCSTCNTAFSSAAILSHHFRFTHMVDTARNYKYYCTICAQGFVKKSSVEIHTAHFHVGETSFIPKPWLRFNEDWEVTKVCRVCNLVFESNEEFIQHNMFYYKGQLFTCMFCDKALYGLFTLHNHIQFVHNGGSIRKQYIYACNICNEAFTLESHHHAHKFHVHLELKIGIPQHLQDHTYVRMFATAESLDELIPKYNCDICYMSFITEKDMRQHKIEYINDGYYLCSFCVRKCLTHAALSKHESSSHTCSNFTDCYKCSYCEEVLPTRTEMKSHEVHFHPETSAPQHDSSNQTIANQTTEASGDVTDAFSCTICDTKFESWEKLNYHSVEYSNQGSYKCLVCNRRFPELHRLQVHKLRHANLNFILSKYHCPVCNEGFTILMHVRMHLMHFHPNAAIKTLTATDQNSQLLDQIAVKFKSLLNSKPKEKTMCPKCLGTFDSARALNNHKARFTNEGSYVCKECGRKFQFAQLLKEHSKKHAADNDRLKYLCPLCDDKFGNSVARYQHVIHLHWNDMWKSRIHHLLHNAEREVSSFPVYNPADQSISSANSELVDAISFMNECSGSQESSATITRLADMNIISTQEEKNEDDQKVTITVSNPLRPSSEYINQLIIGIVFSKKDNLKTHLNESRMCNEEAAAQPSKEGTDVVEVV